MDIVPGKTFWTPDGKVSFSHPPTLLFISSTHILPLPGCMPSYLHSCLHACLHACLPACLPSCLPKCLHSCLQACLYAFLHTCLHTCLRSCRQACCLQYYGFIQHAPSYPGGACLFLPAYQACPAASLSCTSGFLDCFSCGQRFSFEFF
jgi:hypothetical protein